MGAIGVYPTDGGGEVALKTYASKNRSWLELYILDIARQLNLTHWRIELIDEEPGEDRAAQVWIRTESRRAKVLVTKPEDMDDLRNSIVHEVLHLHLEPTQSGLHHAKDHFNPPVWDIVSRHLHEELEVAVSALTKAIAPLMPMPKKTKGVT